MVLQHVTGADRPLRGPGYLRPPLGHKGEVRELRGDRGGQTRIDRELWQLSSQHPGHARRIRKEERISETVAHLQPHTDIARRPGCEGKAV